MDNYEQLAQQIAMLEADYADSKAYADELYASAKALEVQIKQLKHQMVAQMKEDGVMSQVLGQHRYTLAKAPHRLVIPNKEAVPEEFTKVQHVPDNAKIRAHVKEGGCNWARLEQDATHTLRITMEESK